MTTDPKDRDATRLATESLAAGDPTGWFDRLYVEAAGGSAIVPWDGPDANPVLVEWASGREHAPGRAMVVGAGLGRDAAYVASLGYDTTAFDASPAAAAGARERYADSGVAFETADLLHLPERWHGAFDLVVESYTVQSLPPELHPAATDAVVSLVAAGGTLLVIGHSGVEGEHVEGPPWPLTPAEFDRFAETLEEIARDRAGSSGQVTRIELRRTR